MIRTIVSSSSFAPENAVVDTAAFGTERSIYLGIVYMIGSLNVFLITVSSSPLTAAIAATAASLQSEVPESFSSPTTLPESASDGC